MRAITPPPVFVQVHQAPDLLREGDRMEFTLRIGPLPVRWVACIGDVTDQGFTDRQLTGPFRSWIHRHTFLPLSYGGTEVIDAVEAELRPHPFWGLVGLGMWLSLPFLFAFRGWKTRRILERA
jgi:ligand-binding SRPBCC domain-containing protein